jgi:hypothetical protein
MNWPDGVPLPNDGFDYHALRPKTLRKLLGSHLHDQLGDMYDQEMKQLAEAAKKRGKGKGKGKGRGRGKEDDDEDDDDNDDYIPNSKNNIYFQSWDESKSP